MKKRNYKNLEDIAVYLTAKEWRAIFKASAMQGVEASRIILKNNKVVCVYDGYIPALEFWGDYSDEAEETYYTLPSREWKPLLESFGFICINRKVYYGKYYNFRIHKIHNQQVVM